MIARLPGSKVTLTDLTIEGSSGSGIEVVTPGYDQNDFSLPDFEMTVEGVVVKDNIGEYADGAFLADLPFIDMIQTVTLSNNRFINNQRTGSSAGGGLYVGRGWRFASPSGEPEIAVDPSNVFEGNLPNDVWINDQYVRWASPVGPEEAGDWLSLTFIAEHVVSPPDDGCNVIHLHAEGPEGITIYTDGATRGPYPDPDPAGCGYGPMYGRFDGFETGQ